MRLPLIFLLVCSGCSHFRGPGSIKSPLASVYGVNDAGKAATLASDVKSEALVLPTGSSLTLTKFEAIAATPDSKGEPAKEVTEIKLSKPTEWRRTETVVQADTGTVDYSIAKHRIDVAENRYLLFAALGAAAAGGVFLYLKYPTPAMMCGAASIIFFLAWKLADLPAWFYVVGVAAIAGGIALWKGHDRGEADGVKAALAGDVEAKVQPVVKS